MRPVRLARLLLRADAAFEVALALPLVAGRPRALRSKAPIPTRVLGAALLPFAALLWSESRSPRCDRLTVLAAVNAATATAFAAWLSRRRDELPAADRVAVGATALGLAALAGAQSGVSRAL